jgi:hypothetical protein
MMILFTVAYEAIAKWLRRVMLALVQTARPDRKVSQEYYRFPLF